MENRGISSTLRKLMRRARQGRLTPEEEYIIQRAVEKANSPARRLKWTHGWKRYGPAKAP